MRRHGILLLLLMSALALPLRAEDAMHSAKVVIVGGKVDFQREGQPVWHKLRVGMTLGAGDQVRTGETGRLNLVTTEGANLALGPNSEILVASLGANSAHRSAFRLFRGFVRAVLNAGKTGNKLDFYDVNAVAAVKGTDTLVGKEKDEDRLKVEVFSTEHDGVLMSSLKDPQEKLIRPGEEGSFGDKDIDIRHLDDKDLKEANGFDGLPHLDALPTPQPPLPPVDPKKRLKETLGALKLDKKTIATLVQKALKEGTSAALIERLVEEKKEGGGGAYTKLAGETGLGAGLDELIPQEHPTPAATPVPGATPASTPAPTAAPTEAPKPSEQLLKDAHEALDDLRQDLVKDAKNDQALKKNDLWDGNTFIDRQGYRVVLSHVVNLPQPNEVQIFHFSQRQEGGHAGLSLFSHDVTYNQALPADWTTVYKRPLNDPDNLVGGIPNFYKTQESISATSPQSACDICLSHSYGTPVLTGALYSQARQDFYSVQGQPKGQQSFDALGVLQLGSDTISVSAQKGSDQSWQLTYTNQTTNQEIFTAKVWLLDSTGALKSPDSFGVGINHLGGFGPSDSSLAYEMQLSSPDLAGQDIDVLVPATSFEVALP